FMKLTMRLSARATPGTPRTRSTLVSGKVWAKSTLGVSREVTQMSALQFSMVTVLLPRRPMKRPTCTRTRVTAKATPETVMAKRRRSWKRFLRASETMASSSVRERGAGEERAQPRLDALVHEVGRGRPRPAVASHGDQQGHGPVYARPQHLGHGVRVARKEVAGLDGLHDGRAQELERLVTRIRGIRLVLRG